MPELTRWLDHIQRTFFDINDSNYFIAIFFARRNLASMWGFVLRDSGTSADSKALGICSGVGSGEKQLLWKQCEQGITELQLMRPSRLISPSGAHRTKSKFCSVFSVLPRWMDVFRCVVTVCSACFSFGTNNSTRARCSELYASNLFDERQFVSKKELRTAISDVCVAKPKRPLKKKHCLPYLSCDWNQCHQYKSPGVARAGGR